MLSYKCYLTVTEAILPSHNQANLFHIRLYNNLRTFPLLELFPWSLEISQIILLHSMIYYCSIKTELTAYKT